MTLPTLLTSAATALLLVLERLFPCRARMRRGGGSCPVSLLRTRGAWRSRMPEGLVGWFIGTFVFYWWHRLRHRDGVWRIFRQVHHSPARIEILTSFYTQ